MARKATVNLDAMIPRADFALQGGGGVGGEKIQSLGVEQLAESSLVIRNMRKPDFQRETNHRSPAQLVTFLKSYVDRELIPSVILWQSPSYIFVIDGAHRLSAMRAWIEDDYGDGPISQKYYGHEVPEAQKRVATRVRKLIDKEIGKFSMLKAAVGLEEGFSDLMLSRASSTASRSFSLQWVEGDAEKAETSFFKINTQGTPLHKTEERLLRERRKPIAICARSIVRAGTGNKYWLHFGETERDKIEELSRELHGLLFQPELNEPIKTLDLPLGGASSPIDSLNLLMDFIESAAAKRDAAGVSSLFSDDVDGNGTIETLESCLKVVSRITGNGPGSLGLHPAVYFYNSRGKHSQHLFQAVVSIFSERIHSRNKQYFVEFTNSRKLLEEFLVTNKSLIGQAIIQIGSSSRIPRLIEMYEVLIRRFSNGDTIDSDELLKILKLQGTLLAENIGSVRKEFSKETKSEIFLKTSLSSASRCPICEGLIDPRKSISYDHITRRSEGGAGHSSNGQLTHPFCNTGIKS